MDEQNVLNTGILKDTLCAVPRGTQQSQRIGRQILIKSVEIRYEVGLQGKLDVSAATSNDSLRLIVYLDKQCNRATATATDFLTFPFGGKLIRGMANVNNRNRFEILCDKLHDVWYPGITSETSGNVTQPGAANNYHWFHRCEIPVLFTGALGDISAIESNNIGLLVVSTIGKPSFEAGIRIRYTDT